MAWRNSVARASFLAMRAYIRSRTKVHGAGDAGHAVAMMLARDAYAITRKRPSRRRTAQINAAQHQMRIARDGEG